MRHFALLTSFILLLGIGACASRHEPTGSIAPPSAETPSAEAQSLVFSPGMSAGGRHILGYWELVFDFDAVTAEAIPRRFVEGHFNVRRFMEEGPCTICLRLLNFSPQPDETFFIDVEFEHPFPGLHNLTGFDVRGIAIFNASYSFPVTGLSVSDRTLGDMELLNADGYTTLFNPTEYPEGSGKPIFTYSTGVAATPLSNPALLNGFRAFHQEQPRRMFPAGGFDLKTYHIARPAGSLLRVGYVVDANWDIPLENPVVDPVTEFGPYANCYEAYKIEVSIGSGLMPGCGSAPYEVDVYDHQGHATVGELLIEAPKLVSGAIIDSSGVDMGDFTRFTGIIPNGLKVGEGEYKVLIGVRDLDVDPIFGLISAYVMTTASVVWSPIDYEHGWRKDGRTLNNNNYNPHETVLGANIAEDWTYQFLPGGIYTTFECTPITDGEAVYVAINQQYEHQVHALSLADGHPLWWVETAPPDELYAYKMIPTVGNCEIFVGGSSAWSYDKADQQALWFYGNPEFKFDRGGIAIGDGVLVIWSDKNRLYGLNPSTGEWIWDYSTGELPWTPGTPAIADGVVYAGDHGGYAFALDLQTGEEIWKVQFPTGGPKDWNWVNAAPVLADGLVWFGSWNCHLYGLDPANGSQQRDVDLGDQLPVSAPAYDGTYLYQPLAYYLSGFPSPYRVVAISPADGSIAWEHFGESEEAFFAQPAVANDIVWIASDAGYLYHLNPATGANVGPAPYELDNPVLNSPSIWDGRLYVMDTGGKVYAFGPE